MDVGNSDWIVQARGKSYMGSNSANLSYSYILSDIPSKYMHKILKSLPFYGKGMNFSERDNNINGDDNDVDDAENDDSDGEYCTLEPLSDDEHVEDDDDADDDWLIFVTSCAMLNFATPGQVKKLHLVFPVDHSLHSDFCFKKKIEYLKCPFEYESI